MSHLPIEERFWSKVDKTETCWLWTASRTLNGYGHFALSRTSATGAHRIAYEWLVGPIPEGLQLDHLCRVRHCVNPAHLEPVTPRENARRGLRGRLVTTCRQGHPYDEANTYITPDGRRQCRTCKRAYVNSWKRRNPERTRELNRLSWKRRQSA